MAYEMKQINNPVRGERERERGIQYWGSLDEERDVWFLHGETDEVHLLRIHFVRFLDSTRAATKQRKWWVKDQVKFHWNEESVSVG
jgi:hypothetical protein